MRAPWIECELLGSVGRAADMCFSATASFSAATIIAVIGVSTVRRVKHPRELPLAAIPLLFAVQQAVEGALWLQLPAVSRGEAVPALSLSFLVFAKVLWPAYTAFAVLLMEPDLRRRQVLYTIAVLGCTISIYMLSRLIETPPSVVICGHSIDYASKDGALSWASFLYILSSNGAVQNFGVIVLAGFIVSAYAYSKTFVSVWCFFAAGGSSLLYFHFKRAAARPLLPLGK
jgi:hypothetical protein